MYSGKSLTHFSAEVTSGQEVEDFIAESAIMLDFHHPNVLCLVGVCFDTADHLPVILLPFMIHGDLKSYLKSKRTGTLTSSTSASVDTFPGVRFTENMHFSCIKPNLKSKFLRD